MPSERYFGVITLRAGIGAFEYMQNLYVAIDASRIIDPRAPYVPPVLSIYGVEVLYGVPEGVIESYSLFLMGASFGVGELVGGPGETFAFEDNYIHSSAVMVLLVHTYVKHGASVPHSESSTVKEHLYLQPVALMAHAGMNPEGHVLEGVGRIFESTFTLTATYDVLVHTYVNEGASVVHEELAIKVQE